MIRIALLDKPYMFRPVKYTEKFPTDIYFKTGQEMWDWIKLNLMHNSFEEIIGSRVMYDRLEEYSAEDGGEYGHLSHYVLLLVGKEKVFM